MLRKIEVDKKVLIVPDLHQDAGFFTKILAHKSSRNFDVVVFLADYFDTFEEERYPVAKTVDWLQYYHYLYSSKNVPQSAVWLIGNHDFHYLEDYMLQSNNKKFICSGYSQLKSAHIRQNLPISFWHDTEIAVQVGDYILSHAGFHPYHFKPYANVFGQIAEINRQFRLNMLRLASPETSWFWNVGKCIGGNHTVGSPLWLDFQYEFEDMEEFPQIVGHTANNFGVRQKGKSYCLDGNQSCFGVLQNNQLQTFSV